MKYKVLFSVGSLLLFLLACKKDNFEPPKSTLKGRVVYQDQPIGVRSNGVQLELWQPGYAFFNKIPIYVDQDGNFSASLFDGDYKLTRLKGNGPWADRTDTINVSVRGSANVDVPVDPYFIPKNATYQKTADTSVRGTVTLQRVNTTKSLEFVRIYLANSSIVDATNNVASATTLASAITDLTQPVTITAKVPVATAMKGYVFARIGVKTVGVAELAYSPVQQIQLK